MCVPSLLMILFSCFVYFSFCVKSNITISYILQKFHATRSVNDALATPAVKRKAKADHDTSINPLAMTAATPTLSIHSAVRKSGVLRNTV